MPRLHHVHPAHHACGSEADAVVLEAEALEQETIAATARLVAYIDGDACAPVDPTDQYDDLRDAAATVVEIAWNVQDPARQNPYAALGKEISDSALTILEQIRAFVPVEPVPPAAGGSSKS